jgi:tol-pal system-associated acyl-CoA thioesterase
MPVSREVPMKPVFSLPVQINYEDTDAGGVVYYANYLAYMERARNACLRQLGYPLAELQQQCLLFVVVEANIKYLRPAKLDDLIEVTLRVLEIKGASMVFAQQVVRSGELLVNATIRLATLHSDTFLPCRIPADLRQSLDQHQIEYG